MSLEAIVANDTALLAAANASRQAWLTSYLNTTDNPDDCIDRIEAGILVNTAA